MVKPPPGGPLEGGWRLARASLRMASIPLDTDVFVAMNRFKVIEGKEEAFERRWSEREQA